MKFAITLYSTLAVFLTTFDSGYTIRNPTHARPENPNRQAPPPRHVYGAIDESDRGVNVDSRLLTRTRGGHYRRVDNTFFSLLTLDGFVIAVLDQSNFMSGLYYPGTFHRVKMSEHNPRDIRPLSPQDYLDYHVQENFEPFITLDNRHRRMNGINRDRN